MTTKQMIFIIGFLILIAGLLKSLGIQLPDLRGGYSNEYEWDIFAGVFLILVSVLLKDKESKDNN